VSAAATGAGLVRIHGPERGEPRLRLLCLPWAGGRPDAYRAWTEWLPRDVELWGARYPPEPPEDGIAGIARDLATAGRASLGERFALFGHSMGAIVAFELVRELRRAEAALPLLLGVSGEAAPQVARSGRDARTLSDAELLEEVRSFGGTPEALLTEDAAMELLLPGLRRDLELSSAYAYREEEPLDVPILAFASLSDAVAAPAEVAEWAAQSTAAFELHRLPGDHFFLLDAVPVVASFLVDALEEVAR
jgi:medium-chain acyl-[acyl-carrier-protein] hydrolase